MDAVVAQDAAFEQRRDAVGKAGLSPLQKCVAAVRMLAYGGSADSLDEDIRTGESTIMYTKKFCEAVIAVFEAEYLRHPTEADVARQLDLSARRGFLDALGRSTACVGRGSYALQHLKDSSRANPRSCWRRWQISGCGYGTSNLALLDQTTVCTCQRFGVDACTNARFSDYSCCRYQYR